MKNIEVKDLSEKVYNIPEGVFPGFYKIYKKMISFLEESETYVTKENRDRDNDIMGRYTKVLCTNFYLDCESKVSKLTPFGVAKLLASVDDVVEARNKLIG